MVIGQYQWKKENYKRKKKWFYNKNSYVSTYFFLLLNWHASMEGYSLQHKEIYFRNQTNNNQLFGFCEPLK